jgi:hypothetical protein
MGASSDEYCPTTSPVVESTVMDEPESLTGCEQYPTVAAVSENAARVERNDRPRADWVANPRAPGPTSKGA